MKHKRLYKFLCLLEDTIMVLLATVCFIVYCSEPVGDYTFSFILWKIVALGIICLIVKIESE